MTAPPYDLAEPAPATEAPAVIHLPYVPPAKESTPPKTRRGSENRQRSEAFLVRVHPDDAERLKTEAAAAGMM
jgi:hypothetical protein